MNYTNKSKTELVDELVTKWGQVLQYSIYLIYKFYKNRSNHNEKVI